ncbi:MAG: phage tail tip lysozyme [Hyphomicrobiales bacterium]
MDNINDWMGFAQRSRDDGGLGLAKHQAAGLVGNLVNESGAGLNPWGPTGDNGTAMGTAQWRGDRLAALKQAFPDSYQTPQAQQAFMRQEFDGPENKAYQALLASQDPQSAADAVNHLYERSADTTGNRAASAQAIFNGSNPLAAINAAAGIQPKPAGALSSAFANEDDGEDTPPALSANSTMGAGALSPQRVMTGDNSTNKLNVVAQGLTGLGASLAGISSPQQAYSLNAQLASMKKDNESKYKVSIGKDGRIMRVDQDGNVDVIGGNPAETNALSPQMIPTWGNASLLGNDPTKVTPDQQAAYLASMPGAQGDMVKAILENRMPITANAFTRKDSPYPAAFAAAAKLDPTIDPTVYAARQAGQREWATKGAESARALNQTIAHQSDALIGSMQGLGNGGMPLANDVKNWWSEKVNGSGAVPGFRTSAHAVVDELGKVFKQNNLSDTELRKWEDNLPSDMSPDQQRTQISTFHTLMDGAMQSLEDKRKQAIGGWAAAKQAPLLSDRGRAGLQRLDDFAKGGAPASNKTLKPGSTYDWHPQNGFTEAQ